MLNDSIVTTCCAFDYYTPCFMHLSLASPRGGGPRADVGKYWDFMGTFSTNLSPSSGGNVGT